MEEIEGKLSCWLAIAAQQATRIRVIFSLCSCICKAAEMWLAWAGLSWEALFVPACLLFNWPALLHIFVLSSSGDPQAVQEHPWYVLPVALAETQGKK